MTITHPLPKSVKIVEVAPRDGLQNEQQHLTINDKVQFIKHLINAGLQHIEAGSFVSPRQVPQMASSPEVIQALPQLKQVSYSALVPNLKGFEKAKALGLKEIAVFTSASESFCQANIHCTIKESLKRFQPVIEAAQQENIKVRAYISCVIACPYQGKILANTVTQLSKELIERGCHEISLGDTTGVGTVASVTHLLEDVLKAISVKQIAVHFHDTYGQALANIYAALQLGISIIDSSVAGLGGCPFAKSASGNVATEEVVYLLNGLGIKHNISLEKLLLAGQFISKSLNKKPPSKLAQALINQNSQTKKCSE